MCNGIRWGGVGWGWGQGVFVPVDVAKVSSHLKLIQSYLVNWSLSSSQHLLLPNLLKFYYSAGKGTRDYGNVGLILNV